MWNRYNYPTVNDADEGGDILILRNNGRKSIYNWEDFCDEKLMGKDIAWMPLPQSDIPQPITITISSGGRSFTIEMVGNNIEVHDSRDPMGQPIICGDVDDIDGVLLVVESILADHIMVSPDDDEDWCECEGEGVAVNDTVLQGFIDALRGNETASVPASEQKPWQKKRGK
jgi:hypothetical protein